MGKTNFQKVVDFNKAFGIKVHDKLENDIFDKDPKLVQLRVNLICEEVNELSDAVTKKDIKEVIDALSDILYVTYGMGASFGINLDRTFYTVKNNIQNLFDKNLELVNHKMSRIMEKTKNLKNLVDDKDMNNIISTLFDILDMTYDMGILFGIDLNKSFDIVHNSNMSKLCETETEAIKTIEWYKQNEPRYDSPNYRQSEDKKYWVIFNESSGKILKNINYVVANFDQMLTK
jgi:predicted HAD superfamily Cof-like phosphohydrolase